MCLVAPIHRLRLCNGPWHAAVLVWDVVRYYGCNSFPYTTRPVQSALRFVGGYHIRIAGRDIYPVRHLADKRPKYCIPLVQSFRPDMEDE